MKLRLRNLETNETLKIQAPDPFCTLPQLKLILSDRAFLSSSSLHLSLNRKDELLGSNSEAENTLRSLGITSGDLIFFSTNPNSFKSQTLIPQFNSASSSCIGSDEKQETLEPSSDKKESFIAEPNSGSKFSENYEMGRIKTMGSDTRMEETPVSGNEFPQNETLDRNPELGCGKALELSCEQGENQNILGENMEIDTDDGGMGKGFSVPNFLRKLFSKELGDSGGCDHKLVVIAVLAVLKESGFLGFDLISKTKTQGFYLPDTWPLFGLTLSLCYTLPEIVQSSDVVTVIIKVQSLGKYLNFYGSLAGKGSGTYRVCLDKERLATMLNLMWANLDTATENNGSIIYPEKEVFEFWKIVKDKLALPLLIDLCEKANLPPPSCFTRLPTDLKIMILELLPGADVAKAACVSLELNFLASNDDLWKQKYMEQFGNGEVAGGSGIENCWKRKFIKAWESRKMRRFCSRARGPDLWVPRTYRDPSVFRFPRIIGGDYDLGPNIPMGGRPFGRRGGGSFIPNCNFGERRV